MIYNASALQKMIMGFSYEYTYQMFEYINQDYEL